MPPPGSPPSSVSWRARRCRPGRLLPWLLVVTALLAGGACTPEPPPTGQVTILFLGDSLTAGLGVAPDQAFPARVGANLSEQGWDIRVLDAGRSGDTTADGRRRLASWLKRRPDVALVALGGNDGLQRIPLATMEANLSAIVGELQAAGVRVALAGVELPFFVGDASGFRGVYEGVAERYDVPCLDDILADVLGHPGRMQLDGIHPTPEGHAVMAEHVTTFLLSRGVLR